MTDTLLIDVDLLPMEEKRGPGRRKTARGQDGVAPTQASRRIRGEVAGDQDDGEGGRKQKCSRCQMRGHKHTKSKPCPNMGAAVDPNMAWLMEAPAALRVL